MDIGVITKSETFNCGLIEVLKILQVLWLMIQSLQLHPYRLIEKRTKKGY